MDQFSADVNAESAGSESPAKRFVGYVIERIGKDNGFAARLKRADNPATEYQSWEILTGFGIDLEKEWQRLPYCIIGAALAKAKPACNGTTALGAAIAGCYPEGNQSEQAKARLRRLLACSSTSEACRILRPLLALMAGRNVTPDFARLLNELQWFSGNNRERIRASWAQQFYRRAEEAGRNEAGNPHD
ncbi:type I-E CRISPR-associated protein Cse2/CasB [Klebsiella aerogenes]|uniref:type I-E CRISPR-associated protein Cse2/CasB n=1 Tax=Klebsiella aerogenes TaxID=548 RepID=UPI0027FB85DD|nr:type I-E CRISPR-associated protein Cse2/CasB [Klebsiella aerogenes]HCR0143076.1 type I-E CRISPR-associated protein Cse2/CasB [Klebsiella aerogenes]